MQTIDYTKNPIKLWVGEKDGRPDVEQAALNQLINVANLPIIHDHIAVMPDVHAGVGATVGSVIPCVNAVIPAAVGVDIGCGMCAVPTNLTANDLPDSLKDIRYSIEREIPVGFNAYKDESHLLATEVGFFYSSKVDGLLEKYKVREGKQSPVQQLGTLGGGNHFIEVCLDENAQVWVMLHSGSRGIGNKIGNAFIEVARKDMEKHQIKLPDRDLAYLQEGSEYFDDYVTAVEWAQQYASTNRRVMLRRVIRTLSHHFPQLKADLDNRVVNCHHNYISREHHYGKDCIVTRKGAVRAEKGEFGIIPGSMGTRSYIVEGLGNDESFHSCSHGAGRRMSRTKAKQAFTVADHEKATEGVECRKDKGVIDETPAAYKDIDEVMENQKDLVRPVHTLKQVLCVKG
jgi:tRNA-splicing ligase RtcB